MLVQVCQLEVQTGVVWRERQGAIDLSQGVEVASVTRETPGGVQPDAAGKRVVSCRFQPAAAGFQENQVVDVLFNQLLTELCDRRLFAAAVQAVEQPNRV